MQEAATFLGPQNRSQGRCELYSSLWHCLGSPDHDLLAAGAHHGVQYDQGHGEEVTLGAVVTIQPYPSLQTMFKQLISNSVCCKEIYKVSHNIYFIYIFLQSRPVTANVVSPLVVMLKQRSG